MEDNVDDVKSAYAQYLINMWFDIIDYSQEAMGYIMKGEIDNDVVIGYVARLARLWRELKPKVEKRPELKEMEKEFLEFEDLVHIPSKEILSPENAERIYKLEDVLAKVLDRLGLTAIEPKRW